VCVEPYGRSIVIVPSKQLVRQTFKEYDLLNMDVGVYYGDHKDLGKDHTICTWQSLDILMKDSKNKLATVHIDDFLYGTVAVICDEVHSAKANKLKQLLGGPLKNVPIRWGMTGTMPKEEHDQACIIGSIGNVTHSIKTVELQEEGILSNCNINVIQTQEKKEFNNYRDEHEWLVTAPERLIYIGGLIERIAKTGNTLVLVTRKSTGFELEKIITDSVFVHGSIKVEAREKEYEEVATINNKIIIATSGVAAVGINIPRIFNLVTIEPGKAFVRVIQGIGRVLRVAEDKDHAEIYDICSATKYSKRHLGQRKRYYKEQGFSFNITKQQIEEIYA